jgi:selenocysteine lyase/cysteine desulfurase
MSHQSVSERFIQIHSEVRRRFPYIDHDPDGHERIYLNSGAGTLMVDSAVSALARAAQSVNPQPGDVDPPEIATDRLHWRVREIAADFINARQPEEISFHFSTTQAIQNLAYALRTRLTAENNLVVTDLDHMANISPWEDRWGREKGCLVKRARVNEDGCLDVDHLLSLIDKRTGVVALTMASNGFGTIVPLGEVIPLVRTRSPRCLVCVDAVHHALHGPIDVQEIDGDFLTFSGYKIFGPMLGVLWGKGELLDQLDPYRVETNKNVLPYKFEQGTLNNAALAALEGALEYLVWLGEELTAGGGQAGLERKATLRFVMAAIGEYEGRLSRSVLEGFQKLEPDRFRCYGVTDPRRFRERDPTFSFEIQGKSPQEIKRSLWEDHGIQIADGNHYSAAIYRHLGRKTMCRASFAHYDNLETASSFVRALAALLS